MPEISKLDTVGACEKGAELEIKHPVTGEGMGFFLTLVGVDSHTYQRSEDKRGDARIAKRDRTLAMADMRQENIEMLADCTLGWRGFEKDGKEIPFSHAAAVQIYTDFPEVRRQANAFIGNLAAFLRD